MRGTLACFDFDGTITTKDSLPDFIQYAVGKPEYYLGLFILSPLLLGYICKLIPNHKAKQIVISYFFKGWHKDRFLQIANQYSINRIDRITRPNAMKQIQLHQKQGHTVVIVSASMEEWLKEWCEKYSIGLIATSLEICKERITGKFKSNNCYGVEKVKRIKKKYNLHEYSTIYAYGDSMGDKEMLKIATRPYYKYFD